MTVDKSIERDRQIFDHLAVETALGLEQTNALRMLLEAHEGRIPQGRNAEGAKPSDPISYNVALITDDAQRKATIRTTGGDVQASALDVAFTGSHGEYQKNLQQRSDNFVDLTGAINGQFESHWEGYSGAGVSQTKTALSNGARERLNLLGTCNTASAICQYQISDNLGNIKAIAIGRTPLDLAVDKPSTQHWDVFEPSKDQVGKQIGTIDFTNTWHHQNQEGKPRIDMAVKIMLGGAPLKVKE